MFFYAQEAAISSIRVIAYEDLRMKGIMINHFKTTSFSFNRGVAGIPAKLAGMTDDHKESCCSDLLLKVL